MGVRWLTAELVLDAGAEVGEGPRWDHRVDRLVWVDIEGRAVHLFAPDTGRDEAHPMPSMVGAALPRDSGGYVVATQDGVASWRPGESPRLLAELERDRAGRRCNDAACDPAGRLLVGTMSTVDVPQVGRLYRVDPDRTVTRLLDGLGLPNGLDWSPDGRTLYFTDSLTGAVDAYRYDGERGELSDRRPLITVDGGLPDGLTVDAEGNLWIAAWSAGRVDGHTPDGRRFASVRIPIATVTSCGFGGPDLGTLFITTMRPGSLFAVDIGTTGRPTRGFAG